MNLQRKCRQAGGRLVFCEVDPTVYEAFRLSKLEPLFTFVPDREAALRLIDGRDVPESAAAAPTRRESGPKSGAPPLRSRRRPSS